MSEQRAISVPRRVETAVKYSGRYDTGAAEIVWEDMWLLNRQFACKARAGIHTVCVILASAVYAFMLGSINPDASTVIGLLIISSGLMVAVRVHRHIRLRSYDSRRARFRAETGSKAFWDGVDEHLYGPDGVFSKCESDDPRVTVPVRDA